MRFTFGGDASGVCLTSIEQATCADPTFEPYTGGPVPQCTPIGSELVCTFTPALENLRTYRFNLTGGSATLRGLVGDVNSDGSVDAVDRALVVGAWTSPAGFSCETDVDSSGNTNAVDRAFVVGAWTAPQNCAP
jgi:hypothetical protein